MNYRLDKINLMENTNKINETYKGKYSESNFSIN